ncbi:MAG: MBL fold metallo-hydrolase [Deltaproteobacteria bacterium]|nr:MBL fold metallo-hydrolase [Deltaproteobacteria bacterium]
MSNAAAPQAPAPQVMLGMKMPDVGVWSPRVTVALGQNPSMFTGPGTNAYLVGTGKARLLIDPGQGEEKFLPVLEQAMQRSGCERIAEIVCTHGHPDHIGGVRSVMSRFGKLRVRKMPSALFDGPYGDLALEPLAPGDIVRAEGATLRAIHAPGHAPDHLNFILEEERALFSGDNVLGVGTTVIPAESGDLGDYMRSLDRLLAEEPRRIYPAHGPVIEHGAAKLREYIAHRGEREGQILDALERGPSRAMEIVQVVYAAYPAALHAAAAQSVIQHLRKLVREKRASRDGAASDLDAKWQRV